MSPPSASIPSRARARSTHARALRRAAVLLAPLALLGPARALASGASDGPPDAPPARELLVELTASARLAGTSGSAFGAEVVARALERAGFEVDVDERVVLLSLPTSPNSQPVFRTTRVVPS
jgi:hypothetical protein